MNPNLREEIRINVIHKLLDNRNCDYDDITKYIDEILKLIEKRIDSMIVEDTSGLPRKLKEHHLGFNMGLKKVKELLE